MKYYYLFLLALNLVCLYSNGKQYMQWGKFTDFAMVFISLGAVLLCAIMLVEP